MSQGNANSSISKREINEIMEVYDNLMESETAREAWLLENKTITLAIAGCLRRSMQLHLDSFGGDATGLGAEAQSLHSELRTVGDMLRAAVLDKRVSELSEQDHYLSQMLSLGRHIKRKDSVAA